jgi:hypothetical protein
LALLCDSSFPFSCFCQKYAYCQGFKTGQTQNLSLGMSVESVLKEFL